MFVYWIIYKRFKYLTLDWKEENINNLIKFVYQFFVSIRTTLTFFHSSENILSFRQLLKIISSSFNTKTPPSFNTFVLIMSYPWALLAFSFWYFQRGYQRNEMIVKVTCCELLIQGVHCSVKYEFVNILMKSTTTLKLTIFIQ